jgi:CRP-like cAMP-binding protein
MQLRKNMTTLQNILEAAGVKNSVQWITRNYKKGEVIVEENSPGSELFLISQGSVHILLSVQITKDHLEDKGIAKLSAGDFFGEISLFSDDLRTATVVAADDCEIIMLDGASLLEFMDQHPAAGYPIMRFLFETMVERARNMTIRTSTLMSFYLREKNTNVSS